MTGKIQKREKWLTRATETGEREQNRSQELSNTVKRVKSDNSLPKDVKSDNFDQMKLSKVTVKDQKISKVTVETPKLSKCCLN